MKAANTNFLLLQAKNLKLEEVSQQLFLLKTKTWQIKATQAH